MHFATLGTTALFLSLALAGCSGGTGEKITDVPCAQLMEAADGSDPAHTIVQFTTSKGTFKAELFDNKSPVTVENFLTYVNEGYYDNVLFHRIIKDFMVQAGSFDASGATKTPNHPEIKNEAPTSQCRNAEYTLAMARRGNPDVDSASSQFFINARSGGNGGLDYDGSQAPGYAVFGIVFEGREVVDAIEATPVEPYRLGGGQKCQRDTTDACPTEDVVIQQAEVI